MRRLLSRGLTLCALAAIPVAMPDTSLAQEAPKGNERRVTRGMHEQIKFEREVTRVAVGDQKVMTAEVLSSKSILLLGRETGRTSLLVWYADDTTESFVVNVSPDMDMLQRALTEIHAGITVEMAPDREAVVLRGVVPDVNYSRAAEAAAASYLKAGRGAKAPLVAVPSEAAPAAPGAAEGAEAETVRAPEQLPRDSSVINLIRIEKLPDTPEQRVSAAIRDLGAGEVEVRRLMRGSTPDDGADVLLLTGKVRDQILLSRVLHVAGTIFLGSKGGDLTKEVEVTVDEGGGLVQGGSGSSRGGGRSGGSGGSSSGSSGGFGTSGGGGGAASLGNELESNPGRAKAVSLGNGRVLSFIEVSDLPQVRVDVRIFELNRTALLDYAPQFSAILSDFNQGSLSPAGGAVLAQGDAASVVGGTGVHEVQGVISFLAGGFTQEFQWAGSHSALSTVLNVLESRGITRSLSNPSLSVLSGESARFLVGGEVPVPQAFAPAFGSTSTEGTTTPGVFSSVEFRRFGVELAVRPLVGDDGRVTMDLFTNVDRPDEQLTTLIRDATGTDPSTTAFESRRLETTTRLLDGQALLIGGLVAATQTDSASFTPGLERIPILGWLFKRFSVKDEQRELVVMVSPTIVRDRITDLGIWGFPDTTESGRKWVDEMINFGVSEWPRGTGRAPEKETKAK